MPRKFVCPLCRWEGHPSFELVDDSSSPLGGKLAAKCGKVGCSYTDPSLTPADFNEGIAVDKAGVTTTVQTSAPMVPPRTPAPRVQIVARGSTAMVDPEEPVDVITFLRRRRDILETEVARLEAKKIELRKLNKMIAVADREQAKIEAERATALSLVAGGDAE